MADLRPYPDANGDTDDDTGVKSGRASTTPPGYPGTPRWVKVSGIIVLVLVLLVVVLLVVGGGSHGPGRHLPSGGAGRHIPPSAYGPQQP